MKRTLFSEIENKIILEMVETVGEDWEAIAKKLPNRTPKQCHDRYSNYLKDGLKKDPWSKQEDETLIQLFNEFGPKWSKMMNQLPGRSENDIKNRWHKHLVKNYKANFPNMNNNRIEVLNQNDFLYYSNSFDPNFAFQMFNPYLIPNYQPDIGINLLTQQNNNSYFQTNFGCNFQMLYQQNGYNFTEKEIKKARKAIKSQVSNKKTNHANLKDHASDSTNDQKSSKMKSNSEVEKIKNEVSFSTSTNKQSDIFSCLNISEFEIQEFLDNVTHDSIDYSTTL